MDTTVRESRQEEERGSRPQGRNMLACLWNSQKTSAARQRGVGRLAGDEAKECVRAS